MLLSFLFLKFWGGLVILVMTLTLKLCLEQNPLILVEQKCGYVVQAEEFLKAEKIILI